MNRNQVARSSSSGVCCTGTTLFSLLLFEIIATTSGCSDTGTGPSVACGGSMLQEAVIEPGTFITMLRSSGDCHVLHGIAAFEPGSDKATNRVREPTFLFQLEGEETRFTLWFAREERGQPAIGSYRITNLPDEPAGQFETRFITNNETFSVMGLHVSGHHAFSEAGTVTLEASEDDQMIGRFEVMMDLEDASENAHLVGRFAAVPADLSFPIVL